MDNHLISLNAGFLPMETSLRKLALKVPRLNTKEKTEGVQYLFGIPPVEDSLCPPLFSLSTSKEQKLSQPFFYHLNCFITLNGLWKYSIGHLYLDILVYAKNILDFDNNDLALTLPNYQSVMFPSVPTEEKFYLL